MRFPCETVYLARHGRTEWNELGRRQGQLDSPLTDLGRRQAEQVAERVNGLGIDAVFSSPLGRSWQTASVCGQRLGLPVVVIEELAELHHGQWAGLTSAEIEQRYPGELAARATNKYSWRFPGGESYADADPRALVALDRVAATGARRPLLVSHEMIGRLLWGNLVGAAPAVALARSQRNDVVYEIDVATGNDLSLEAGTADP